MSDTHRHKQKAKAKRGLVDPPPRDEFPHVDNPLPTDWTRHFDGWEGWAYFGSYREKIRNLGKRFHELRNRKIRHTVKLAIRSGNTERMYRDYNGNRRWRARK